MKLGSSTGGRPRMGGYTYGYYYGEKNNRSKKVTAYNL